MKKILLFLIIILTFSHVGLSRTRDINEMKQIAAIALKQQYGSEMLNGVATPDFSVLKETDNYCLLSNNSVGTVIVAKNDLYGPVLGCSTTPCDLENLPCGFKWWLDAIDGSLNGNREVRHVPVPNGYPQSVDPLVKVNWGQNNPYNNMCPNGYLVGCVAVAMGQIMSAYRCPNVGNGSYSYNSGGQVISANFGETTYDWNKILAGNYSEIAKLLFHCGVAVQTEYSSSVSTAFLSNIRSGLINYFRYSSDAVCLYRNYYSENDWFNILYVNLVNGHPIAYRGASSDSYSASGHAFVVDGYNSNGEMHINWGWNGLMDGYFDLSYIDYPYQQSMVCEIKPDSNQPLSETYLTLDMGGDGVVKLIADEGSTYEYIIQTDENWALDNVYFNNEDVTETLVDNTYITPAINQNSTIRVLAHDTTHHSLYGDVNDDGEVNIADINTVIDVILTNTIVYRADVNGDNEINIADVNTIIDLILNPPLQNMTITVNGVTFTMVCIPGNMNASGTIGISYEGLLGESLASYCIGQTEVTQALWLAVMGSNPSRFKGDLNRPVENVSWNDCQMFITKLNEMTNKLFRLPTGAEWEFAALGGNKTHNYEYAGSNNINDVAWWGEEYGGNSGYSTHTVATKLPNELGLYDMSGNVWEWCQDLYGNYNQSVSYSTNTTINSGSNHMIRGGGWNGDTNMCKVLSRGYNTPTCRYDYNGLRLAL